MHNLDLYEKVRAVPDSAQKEIEGGRLKGMTDINPMWRIRTLTEHFGVCGIGWKTQIVRTWLDEGANGEIVANVEIRLFIKMDGQWSEGIPGLGGSRLIAKESSGLYTDDECYKKAYTDAISVACKALGFGADIYWQMDRNKYTFFETQKEALPRLSEMPQNSTMERRNKSKWVQVNELINGSEITLASVSEWIIKSFGTNIKINNLNDEQFGKLMSALKKKIEGESDE